MLFFSKKINNLLFLFWVIQFIIILPANSQHNEISNSVQKVLFEEGEILIHDAKGYSKPTSKTDAEKKESAEKAAIEDAMVQLTQRLKRIIISSVTDPQVQENIEKKFEKKIKKSLTPFAEEIAPVKFDSLEDGSLLATLAVRMPLNKSTVNVILEVVVKISQNRIHVIKALIVISVLIVGASILFVILIYRFKRKKFVKLQDALVLRISALYIRKGNGESLWIGNTMDDDIYIEDSNLREKYAKLSFTPNGLQLESEYGINLNTKTVSKIDLNTNGIQFKLGSTPIRYSNLDISQISSITEKSIKKSVVIVDPWIARFEIVDRNCQATRQRILNKNSVIHIGRLNYAEGYHIRPGDIILRENISSRTHARIYYDINAGHFSIENTSASSAIILYSERKVIYKNDKPHPLNSGSIFQIGDTEFYVSGLKTNQSRTPALGATGTPTDLSTVEFNDIELIELYYKVQEIITSDIQLLSFLSLDVVGSSQMKIIKKPSDHIAIQYSFEEYHKYVREITHSRHGQIFSTAGDGIICRFESVQEAVDAAIEVLEKLAGFNRARNRLSMPFILRTGIETGEVIGGKDLSVDQIFSSVVDIAAHIQKNSHPGELTISERVYNQISNKRDFKGPVGEVDGQLIYQSIRSTKN